jgi:methylphosphotriester-DNA--protein-cysteine methyltransferase
MMPKHCSASRAVEKDVKANCKKLKRAVILEKANIRPNQSSRILDQSQQEVELVVTKAKRHIEQEKEKCLWKQSKNLLFITNKFDQSLSRSIKK